MKMIKNKIILGLIAFTLILNCDNRNESVNGSVTITFWHSFVSSTLPALRDLIRKFEETHPDIHIKAQYIPTGDALVQKLITAIQSRTAPDISWVHADFLQKLVQANAIYPMRYFIDGPEGLSKETLDDIFPILLQAASWQDTLYAIPMEATTLALLYNIDLFNEVGLDPRRPPQTWNELYDYAKRLTLDKDSDGHFDQYGFYIPVFPASGALSIWVVLQWSPYLWQAGGQIIDQNQQFVFNSDAGVQALTLWKRLYQDLRLDRFSLAHDLGFASNTLAMVMDGPWNLPRYRRMKQTNWAVAPLPTGPVKKVTYLAGEHLAIFKQSKYPLQAWSFIKWILRLEVQARFSMSSGYLPVRRSTLELKEYQEYLDKHPHHKAFVEQMKIGLGRERIDHYQIEINQLIAEALEKAIVGDIDPRTALDEAAVKSNELISLEKTRF